MGIDDQTFPAGVFGKADALIVGGMTMLSSTSETSSISVGSRQSS